MIDRAHIGFSTPPTTVTIDAWRVRLFCQAIGETDPVHWDADAATRAGHAGCPVPPTFLKALETDHCSSALLMERLGVPLRTVLHAAQSFDGLAPLHVGDRIEISRRITDSYDKRDGALSFIVVDTSYLRNGTPLGSSRQTIVARNRPVAQEPAVTTRPPEGARTAAAGEGGPVSASHSPGGRPDGVPAGAPPARLQLECGPVGAPDLALYAAASSDHNPLHLDEETARAAGFERPVVHGMLTMAFAARLFTSHFGPHALHALETRFVGVALRGQRIVLTGTLEQAQDGLATYQLDAHDGAGMHLLAGRATVHWPPTGATA